jgi:hypothetical protein
MQQSQQYQRVAIVYVYDWLLLALCSIKLVRCYRITLGCNDDGEHIELISAARTATMRSVPKPATDKPITGTDAALLYQRVLGSKCLRLQAMRQLFPDRVEQHRTDLREARFERVWIASAVLALLAWWGTSNALAAYFPSLFDPSYAYAEVMYPGMVLALVAAAVVFVRLPFLLSHYLLLDLDR